MEPYVKLSKMLVRMFYEPAYFIILDIVLKKGIVSEEFLSEKLQMQLKQVNKLTVKLREDHFLQCETRVEIREYDGKSISRSYWFIDFKSLVDTTRWRLKKMSRYVEEKIQKGASGGLNGYKCNQCGFIYGLLDVDRLVTDFQTGVLQCEICKGEIEDEQVMSSSQAADLYSRLNQALKPIVSLLKEIEQLPQPLGTSKNHIMKAKPSNTHEAEEKTYFNESLSTLPSSSAVPAIPVWHSHSTVSGQAVKSIIREEKVETCKKTSDESHSKIITNENSNSGSKRPFVLQDSEEKNKEKRAKSDSGEPFVDICVLVQGKPIPIMQITESDKKAMSAEESAIYYEEYMKIFGDNSFL